MHVFVSGGTGQTGPAIVSELLRAGHRVTGLARSEASAARVSALGAQPWRGSIEDLDGLGDAARRADGVIHMAFGGDYADAEDLARRDCAAIDALGKALVGTDKPLVSTSGTLVLAPGRIADEMDQPDRASVAAFRIPGEATCLGFADRGVRASILRLAPTVHGPADWGFIPAYIAAARRNHVAAYIGDGTNRWPAVHRFDAATLFRLALEKAPAGSVLHGVAQSAITITSIAEKVSEKLGIPTASLSADAATDYFANPFLATFFSLDVPVSSIHTRRLLGWDPTNPTLLQDLDDGDYFALQASQRAEQVWLTKH